MPKLVSSVKKFVLETNTFKISTLNKEDFITFSFIVFYFLTHKCTKNNYPSTHSKFESQARILIAACL